MGISYTHGYNLMRLHIVAPAQAWQWETTKPNINFINYD